MFVSPVPGGAAEASGGGADVGPRCQALAHQQPDRAHRVRADPVDRGGSGQEGTSSGDRDGQDVICLLIYYWGIFLFICLFID